MSIRSHEALAAAACQPPAVNALIKLLPVTQAVFIGFPIIGTQSVAALLSRAWRRGRIRAERIRSTRSIRTCCAVCP